MIINNNPLLKILLPNDNKILKEVLKEADNKTFINKNGSNVQDIIKNLFTKVQDGTTNKSDLNNLLKNSSVFKDLGSVSGNIKNLLSELSKDPSLQTLKNKIESFLKDITLLDEKSLKTSLNNSGVFLESKLAKLTKNNNLTSKVEKLLVDIKISLKDNPSIGAKNIVKTIDILLNQKNTSSSFLKESLTNISKDLKNILITSNNKNTLNLNNELEKVNKNLTLLTSKQNNQLEVKNEKIVIQEKTYEILKDLKTTLNQNPKNNTQLLSQINKILDNKNTVNNPPILKEVLTNVLNHLEKNTNFLNKNLLNTIKENITQNSTKQSNLTLNMNIKAPTEELSPILKNNINILKDVLNTSLLENKIDLIKILDKIVSTNNLNSLNNTSTLNQELLKTNTSFSSNLQNLLNTLKESVTSTVPAFEKEVFKNLKGVEKLLNNSQNLLNKDMGNIKEDFKVSLLLLKEEIISTSTNKESLKHLDKLISQIDYHQLLSISSDSSHVYLPFIWDMLEDGNISLKQLKEDKFFCEINLSLKEMGNIKILLALYNENSLDITLYAQKDNFKHLFKNDIKDLKKSINKLGLIPGEIKILNLKEDNELDTKAQKENLYLKSFDNISLGLDIKV